MYNSKYIIALLILHLMISLHTLFRILADIAIGSHLASDHSLLSIVINASRRVEIFKK